MNAPLNLSPRQLLQQRLQDAQTATPHVTVTPQSAHIGALIGGVDLHQPLTAAEVNTIHSALLQWKVVFFREQHLSHEQHVAFSSQFGELTIGHPVFGHVDGHPELYSIAKHRRANSYSSEPERRPWTGWHTDVTAAVNPPAGSILRGVTIPPYGGDTQWTNLVAAYEALSEPLKAFLNTLRGEHRFSPPAGANPTAEYLELIQQNTLVSEHPLITLHPETGEKILFISPGFLKTISGLHTRESRVLLELLWEHAVRSEFTVRFKWEPGSIAFWDNRSTAHVAPQDIFDLEFDRQLYRSTLVGTVPVGADGRPSTAVQGNPVLAAHGAAF
ncbi:TauD/TfdA dioxygenase family protein [Comamonas jiangduensis]|uniref:TauD/TfdA dioxygenase family protein n=1 Tax=Comamonas jiangduensis TaxID=1194168 RepID=UPI0015841E3E|nr:TauD/TfdA family dioxygenase [Comamonas jiangduensis]